MKSLTHAPGHVSLHCQSGKRAKSKDVLKAQVPSSALVRDSVLGGMGRGEDYSPGVRQHRAFLGGLVYPKDPSTKQRVHEGAP
jgi:hypothetical protein